MLQDNETEESSGESVEPAPVDEEKLSVFKDFIETLDIEDLGKGGADPRK
jgi:hypothetical protein